MKRVALLAFASIAVLAGLALIGSAPSVSASCGHYQNYNYGHGYHAQNYNYATPVLVAQFLPVPVAAYSVGYSQQDQALVQKIEQLQQKIDKLTSAPVPQVLPQQAPAQQPVAQPQQAPVGFRHVEILKANCSSCHDKATSGKGGGFAMLDGDLLPLSAQQKMDIIYRITLPKEDPKHMPRGKDLPLEDASEITLGLVHKR